jgi:type II secretory pathway pseudopilin PulG
MYDTRTKRMTAAELLIVVLVLSTLAAISVPRLSHSATLNKQMRCNSNIELYQAAVDLHSSQLGQYPDTLEKVMNNREFFPAGAPKCPLGGTYLLKSDHTVICTHP